ncbi:EcoRII family protein [Methylophilaceae bacterium 11]|nr:EcoRII family protein [Methylophilaceae bacterium 11]
MFSDKLSDYFEGVAAKYLSAVDAEPSKSNQHEIGGLPSAGFKKYLGIPGKQEEYRFRARQIYITDETEDPVTCDSQVTWYDSRRKSLNRGPEYRLYYYDSPVINLINPGDFFLIAKLQEGVIPAQLIEPNPELFSAEAGNLLMIFTPAGSSIEHQLRVMFGLDKVDESFSAGKEDAISLLLPLRMMLEDIGIDFGEPKDSDDWLKVLLDKFGGATFPTTAAFSSFARETIGKVVSPIDDPDATLMAWMEHEESLFRIYERNIVQERLRAGFGNNGEDVDAFIDFSLSVQNRRKSRVGHAFEGHIGCLFDQNGLQYEQGRGKGKVTENNAKPDFIFPSFEAYHAAEPNTGIYMLGAKTTCKDRWRQILPEANKISTKHLITLEAAISEQQTFEMQHHQVQLVIPAAIHATYKSSQVDYLWTVADFIGLVNKT